MTQAANLGALGTNAGTTGVLASAGMPTGSVLQVVQSSYSTQTTTSSLSFSSSGLTATITPKFSTSKVLVLISNIIYVTRAGLDAGGKLQLVRGATSLVTQSGATFYLASLVSNTELITQPFLQYLDSPATTSATTYTLNIAASGVAGTSATAQYNNNTAYITLMEIAA